MTLIVLPTHPTRPERPPLTPGVKCTGFVLVEAGGQEGASQPLHLRGEGRPRNAQGFQAVPGLFGTTQHTNSSYPSLVPSLEEKWEEPHPRAQNSKTGESLPKHTLIQNPETSVVPPARGPEVGAGGARHVTHKPAGIKSAGTRDRTASASPTPFKGLQKLILLRVTKPFTSGP